MVKYLQGSWTKAEKPCFTRGFGGDRRPKHLYVEQAWAERDAARMGRRFRQRFDVYWCPRHNGWHVGRGPARLRNHWNPEVEIELGERAAAHLKVSEDLGTIRRRFASVSRRLGRSASAC